jgi:hypothetical protein
VQQGPQQLYICGQLVLGHNNFWPFLVFFSFPTVDKGCQTLYDQITCYVESFGIHVSDYAVDLVHEIV